MELNQAGQLHSNDQNHRCYRPSACCQPKSAVQREEKTNPSWADFRPAGDRQLARRLAHESNEPNKRRGQSGQSWETPCPCGAKCRACVPVRPAAPPLRFGPGPGPGPAPKHGRRGPRTRATYCTELAAVSCVPIGSPQPHGDVGSRAGGKPHLSTEAYNHQLCQSQEPKSEAATACGYDETVAKGEGKWWHLAGGSDVVRAEELFRTGAAGMRCGCSFWWLGVAQFIRQRGE